MNASEVIEAVERDRARLLAAVAALGDGAMTVPVTPEGWTAKDALGHCIHWLGQIAVGMGAKVSPPEYVAAFREAQGVRRGAATGAEARIRMASLGYEGEAADRVLALPERPDVETWNQMAVEYYSRKSLDDVTSEVNELTDALIEQVRRRSDEQLQARDTVPWAQPEPLWKQIGNETFLHWPEHTADIERAAGVA